MTAIATKLTLTLATASLLCASTGCAPQYATPQQAAAAACSALGPRALSGAAIGGLGGAAGGAAIGAAAGRSRGAAIGAGVGLAAGLLSGLVVGHQLDQNDCARAQFALQQAAGAPVGQAAYWTSPTGSRGAFTPTSDTFVQDGRFCRRLRSDVQLQGHAPVSDVALACRTSEGDYVRVSAPASVPG